MKLSFDLGQSIFVERRVGRTHIKATSSILGAREPNLLIIDMPQVDSKTLFLNPADDCIVRFFVDGRMIGFRAHTVKTVLDPVPMAVLRFPEEIEEKKVRRHNRINCSIASSVAIDDPPAKERALSKRIEIAGAEGAVEKSVDRQFEELSALAPLNSTIINLSQGGFQIVLPVLDEKNPRGAAGLVALGTPVASHLFYRWEILDTLFVLATRLSVAFELPAPVGSIHSAVVSEVRWALRQKDNCFVGLRFIDPPEEAVRDIGALIEHQVKYFSAPVKPV